MQVASRQLVGRSVGGTRLIESLLMLFKNTCQFCIIEEFHMKIFISDFTF